MKIVRLSKDKWNIESDIFPYDLDEMGIIWDDIAFLGGNNAVMIEASL